CAHAMGAEYQGKKVGTFGDVSFFSLGRSKVISCVSGGMVVVNNKIYAEAVDHEITKCAEMPKGKIFQYLYHPVVCSKAKFLYGIQIGKLTMLAAQKLKLINFEVTPAEKAGKLIKPFPTRLPNALAKVALVQFSQLEKFNARRKAIAKRYFQSLANIPGLKLPKQDAGAIWLRFPIEVAESAKLMAAAKAQGIILGDWYTVPVAPPGINKEKSYYLDGECPQTEKICQKIVNLPTHQGVTDSDLEKIIKICSKLD
ncbi:DegT/DnrJ/EryC1/StrS family aminotransferase, partial [Candidatus Peregrinibacteria bacterium]|nr:DegT/DnrJ/EryC1/StrS family aminotransferase [Candidatus Peregrinibacteria bacterium]